jgi:LysR family glycine cleavage system transcriptional activator
MRQLEQSLGTALFVRHHRRLSLTSTGQAYLSAVHEALDRLNTVTDQLFPDRQQQVVTIRCTPSIGTLWLAPRIGRFHNFYPDISISIKTLDQQFGDENPPADLEMLLPAEGKTEANDHKLLTVTILSVCSPRLMVDSPRLKEPREVLKFKLTHVLGYDDDWHRWFRRYGLHDVRIPGGLSVDSSLIAIEAALRGDGIMLGRRPFINAHLEPGELVEVFSRPYPLSAHYVLRSLPQSESRQAVGLVANWLTGLAAADAA